MKTIKISLIVWLSIIVIGILLMIFKITVDSEPGAIPVFLVIIGTLGLLFKRLKKKK